MAKKYRCPYCDNYKDESPKLIEHIEEEHPDLIPKGYSATRVVYNIRNKRDHGTCPICKKPTPWNEKNARYDVLCGRKSCHDKYVKRFEENMIRIYNKPRLLDDMEQQEKMLANRRISGAYKFQDGGVHTYTGSFELKALEFFDKVLEVKSNELMVPGPILEYKDPQTNTVRNYIPDIYWINLNLLIEVKDGGNNPNTRNMPIYRAKQEAKEKMITDKGEFNYLRLTNNNFAQLLSIIAEIKKAYLEGDKTPIVRINEAVDLDQTPDDSRIDPKLKKIRTLYYNSARIAVKDFFAKNYKRYKNINNDIEDYLENLDGTFTNLLDDGEEINRQKIINGMDETNTTLNGVIVGIYHYSKNLNSLNFNDLKEHLKNAIFIQMDDDRTNKDWKEYNLSRIRKLDILDIVPVNRSIVTKTIANSNDPQNAIAIILRFNSKDIPKTMYTKEATILELNGPVGGMPPNNAHDGYIVYAGYNGIIKSTDDDNRAEAEKKRRKEYLANDIISDKIVGVDEQGNIKVYPKKVLEGADLTIYRYKGSKRRFLEVASGKGLDKTFYEALSGKSYFDNQIDYDPLFEKVDLFKLLSKVDGVKVNLEQQFKEVLNKPLHYFPVMDEYDSIVKEQLLQNHPEYTILEDVNGYFLLNKITKERSLSRQDITDLSLYLETDNTEEAIEKWENDSNKELLDKDFESKADLDSQYNDFNLMHKKLRRESDWKSMDLFNGKTNEERYREKQAEFLRKPLKPAPEEYDGAKRGINEATIEAGTPEELYKELKSYSYGMVVEPKDYKTLSPVEVQKHRKGICWDFVTLENNIFKTKFRGMPSKCYYMQRDSDFNTHTFLMYNKNGKYYIFEVSWGKHMGIHEFNSKDEALKTYLDEFLKDSKKESKRYVLIEYPCPRPGMSSDQFINWIYSRGTIIKEVGKMVKFLTDGGWTNEATEVDTDVADYHFEKVSYGQDQIDNAKEWSANSGIVIITPQSTLEDLEFNWNQYNSQHRKLQRESDWKSQELFGMNNETHYNYLKSKFVKKDIDDDPTERYDGVDTVFEESDKYIGQRKYEEYIDRGSRFDILRNWFKRNVEKDSSAVPPFNLDTLKSVVTLSTYNELKERKDFVNKKTNSAIFGVLYKTDSATISKAKRWLKQAREEEAKLIMTKLKQAPVIRSNFGVVLDIQKDKIYFKLIYRKSNVYIVYKDKPMKYLVEDAIPTLDPTMYTNNLIPNTFTDMPCFTPAEFDYYGSQPGEIGFTVSPSLSKWLDEYTKLFKTGTITEEFTHLNRERIQKIREASVDEYLSLGWNPAIPFTPKYRAKIDKRINEAMKLSIVSEAKKFPIQIDDEWNITVTIPGKLDIEQSYQECHMTMKEYAKVKNIDGLKYEIVKMKWLLENVNRNLKDKSLDKDTRKILTDQRARIINDYKKYLNLILKNDPKYNITKHYLNSPYYDKIIKIDGSTVKALGSTLRKLYPFMN